MGRWYMKQFLADTEIVYGSMVELERRYSTSANWSEIRNIERVAYCCCPGARAMSSGKFWLEPTPKTQVRSTLLRGSIINVMGTKLNMLIALERIFVA